jgi:hypothetical protein
VRHLRLVEIYSGNLARVRNMLDVPIFMLTLNLIFVLLAFYYFVSTRYLGAHSTQTLLFVYASVMLIFGVAVGQRFVESQRDRTHRLTGSLLDAFAGGGRLQGWDQQIREMERHNRWVLMSISYIQVLLFVLVLVAVSAEVFWFDSVLKKIWLVMWHTGGYLTVLLTLLMLGVSWRGTQRYREEGHAELTGAGVVWVAGLSAIFYLLSVLSFSLWVYPFIPSQRGGGDYTESRRAVLYFTQEAAGFLPADIADGKKTVPLVILEETPQLIFVADPTKDGGPERWREEPVPRVPVIEIPRSDIVGIIRASPGMPDAGSQSH